MKSRVLIAGCGDLGCQLGKLLVEDGMLVSGLRRSHAALPQGIEFLQGDVTQPQSLASLAAVAPEVLVYCVSAGIQSDENYRALYVDGLRNVLQVLNQEPQSSSHLRHVFFVSSTRVYGQQTEVLLSEQDLAMPSDFGGRRLLEAERLLAGLNCPGTALRLSGIYGPGRGRMLKLARQPQAWPEQNSWTNRIHRDDAAAFIAFLVRLVVAGEIVDDCYLVTDSCPVPQYEVLMVLAEQMGIEAHGVVPPPPQGGKRLSNARMLSTGFELRYPNYEVGYAELMINDQR